MTYTADQIALQAHIEAENDKSRAEMEANPDLWIGIIASDPEHWAGYGITTIEGYEHYMAACTNFEVFRDTNGYKPSWQRYTNMTTAEIEADTESMCDYVEGRNAQRDAEANALAEKLGHSVETLKRWGVV